MKRSEEELKRLYLQVLQMQQSSSIDRCRAYHQLIRLHLKGLQRSEAERLLVAFEVQALSLPPDHWVYDDLKDDTASVFGDRRVLDYARQAAAEGDEERAFRFLSNTLEHLVPLVFKPWVTTEDQFEVYMLAIDLHLRRRQMKQVRDLFVEFAAQAQKQPPEDPVHETVRDLAARLQETSEEQK